MSDPNNAAVEAVDAVIAAPIIALIKAKVPAASDETLALVLEAVGTLLLDISAGLAPPAIAAASAAPAEAAAPAA